MILVLVDLKLQYCDQFRKQNKKVMNYYQGFQ